MTLFWAGLAAGIFLGWKACFWWLPKALSRAEVERSADRMRRLIGSGGRRR